MAEDMADNGEPGEMHISAYAKWGSGGWGLLLTGESHMLILSCF